MYLAAAHESYHVGQLMLWKSVAGFKKK